MIKKTSITNNGKKGGNLVGKPHKNESGKDVGGIKAVVTDANNQPVELEGGEVIINKAASKKYWRELSKINQSEGNGVPINAPIDPIDEDPTEYEKGGKIEFNANKIPNKWILNYAEKIKSEHPEIWKLGGNIFGNEAFENLKRVAKRGYWLDEERWMYIKWQSYVARHKKDFRIAGVVAMLKWVDKVDKGWSYMKQLIESEIQKKSKKKGFTKKLLTGGNLKNDCINFIIKSEPIKKNGYYLHIKNLNAYINSGDKIISNIKSFCLITYNSGGQSNLKASNTINAFELSSEISKLLDCEITIAKIIVSEQIKYAKRFSLDMVKSIQQENIIVADRDKIVCTNINSQYKQGGKVDSYKDKYNRKYKYEKGKSHSLEDIAKDSGVSIKGIQQIYNKGIGAYKTNPQSVRPNVKSKEQWAMARVYSSVMGGKASIVDKNELKLSKGGEIKWKKNIDNLYGWNDNPYDHEGGYISEDGDFKIYRLGYWVQGNFGEEIFERNGGWTVNYKDKPIGSKGSSERMVVDRLKDIKEFVSQINNEKFEKGGKVKKSDILNSAYYSKGGVTNNCESFDEEGKRKIDKKSIQKLTECILKLPQTKELNTDNKGNYTKKRHDLHLDIINKFKKDLVCIENDEPIAILMGGSPASGKSTFLRKYRPFLLNSELLKIDADEIRAKLPEYKGFNATQTHSETKDIVNTLISDKTIGIPCDFDIIYDGTMNSLKSYIPLIKLLKSRNYKIFIVYIDNVEYDIVLNRMLSRYQKSGRFVPVEVIDDFFTKGKEALNTLKKDVDGYLIVDGSTNDYNILEEGGMKLPKSRVYSKLGRPLNKINKLSKGGQTSSTVNDLQKGDTITIEFGSVISNDNKVNLKVRSRRKVGKSKIDKITFENVDNPSGVRFYAYGRITGGFGFAQGDLAISNVTIKKSSIKALNKPATSTSTSGRNEYFVGDEGFYNGKIRIPIEITKITGKNVYFKDGNNVIKRSEKRNFDKLYEAVKTGIFNKPNKNVQSKPKPKKPVKQKTTKSPVIPTSSPTVNTSKPDYYFIECFEKLYIQLVPKLILESIQVLPKEVELYNIIKEFDTNIDDFARIQIETLEEIRKAYTNKKLPAFGGIRRYKNIPSTDGIYFQTLKYLAALTVGEGLLQKQQYSFNFYRLMNRILDEERIKLMDISFDKYPDKYVNILEYETLKNIIPKTSYETNKVIDDKLKVIFSEIQDNLGYDAESFFQIYFYLNQTNQKDLYENGLSLQPLLLKQGDTKLTSFNFNQWFANSVVKEEKNQGTFGDGEKYSVPQVVYHGTGANEFTKFNFDKFPIVYFAENKEYSDYFQKAKGGDGVMFECYLRVQNPIDLKLFGVRLVKYDEFVGYILLKYGYKLPLNKMLKALSDAEGGLWAWRYIRNAIEWLKMIKNDGAFDGIKYYENNPADIKGGVEAVTPAWAVFSPEQIKSSRGNLTFSYDSKDIRFNKGGFINN